MKFKTGDRVVILPHSSEESKVCGTVVNPCDPTDMLRLDGSPVGFYVRVDIDGKDKPTPGWHNKYPELTLVNTGGGPKNQGFHESSLEEIIPLAEAV